VDGDHVGGVLLPLVRSPKSTSELVEPGVAPSLKTGALLEPDKLLLTKPMLALGSPVIVTTWRCPQLVLPPQLTVTVPELPVPVAEYAHIRKYCPEVSQAVGLVRSDDELRAPPEIDALHDCEPLSAYATRTSTNDPVGAVKGELVMEGELLVSVPVAFRVAVITEPPTANVCWTWAAAA
jgi:hypothetical protein